MLRKYCGDNYVLCSLGKQSLHRQKFVWMQTKYILSINVTWHTWEDLGKILDENPDKIRRTWENLRDQYRRDLKRELHYGTTSKWRFYKDMSFIRTMVRIKENPNETSDGEPEPDPIQDDFADNDRLAKRKRSLAKLSQRNSVMQQRQSVPTIRTAKAKSAQFQPILLSSKWKLYAESRQEFLKNYSPGEQEQELLEKLARAQEQPSMEVDAAALQEEEEPPEPLSAQQLLAQLPPLPQRERRQNGRYTDAQWCRSYFPAAGEEAAGLDLERTYEVLQERGNRVCSVAVQHSSEECLEQVERMRRELDKDVEHEVEYKSPRLEALLEISDDLKKKNISVDQDPLNVREATKDAIIQTNTQIAEEVHAALFDSECIKIEIDMDNEERPQHLYEKVCSTDEYQMVRASTSTATMSTLQPRNSDANLSTDSTKTVCLRRFHRNHEAMSGAMNPALKYDWELPDDIKIKDDDYHFCMSVLPSLRRIPRNRKLRLRMAIMNLITTELDSDNDNDDA